MDILFGTNIFSTLYLKIIATIFHSWLSIGSVHFLMTRVWVYVCFCVTVMPFGSCFFHWDFWQRCISSFWSNPKTWSICSQPAVIGETLNAVDTVKHFMIGAWILMLAFSLFFYVTGGKWKERAERPLRHRICSIRKVSPCSINV